MYKRLFLGRKKAKKGQKKASQKSKAPTIESCEASISTPKVSEEVSTLASKANILEGVHKRIFVISFLLFQPYNVT